MKYPVSLSRAPYTLRGYLLLPEPMHSPEDIAHGGRPLILYFHGLLDSCEYKLSVALTAPLAEAGYPVLVMDFHGHGRSDGALDEMTISGEFLDGEAILTYALSLTAEPMVLIGHSQGGIAASVLAARHPDAFRTLILLAPAGNIPDCVRKGKLLGAAFDPLLIPDHIIVFGEDALGKCYAEDAFRMDCYKEAAGFRNGKVCLLHGSLDDLVPVSAVQRYAELYADPVSDLLVHCCEIPDATHEFTGMEPAIASLILMEI